MSDHSPGQHTGRQLTLKVIEATSSRARQAQRRLSGRPPAAQPASEPRDGGADADLDADPWPSGIEPAAAAPLPHPIATADKLAHFLNVATEEQQPGEGVPGVDHRLRRWLGLGNDQGRFNGAVVEVLHQLDHRTQLQERLIASLEAELAEARRAITVLESAVHGAEERS